MNLRANDWLVYGLAGISAVLAVFFVYGYVQNQVELAQSNTEVRTVTVVEKPKLLSVVVAARDVYRGEKLEVDDLKVLQVPTDGVTTSNVIVNPQDAVGHVAQQTLFAGEWILKQKIDGNTSAEMKSVSALLGKERRAMRFPVGAHNGLLGMLNPGDHVDIISVFESTDSKRMISRVILQNISVLSIGQNNRMTAFTPKSDNLQSGNNPETVQSNSMIAVDVSVKEAEQLALAMNVGALHVLLRNGSDADIIKTDGVNLRVMESGKGRAPIYKPKTKREVIEVLQGGSVQEVITR